MASELSICHTIVVIYHDVISRFLRVLLNLFHSVRRMTTDRFYLPNT